MARKAKQVKKIEKDVAPAFYDPYKIRPVKKDWVIVLADERETVRASGIVLLPDETGVEKVTEAAGTIIRVSHGPVIDLEGIKAGDRVVYRTYLRHANRIPTEDSSKWFFFLAVDDIMAIPEPGVAVGVFSGRPQVPERKKS